MPSRPIASHSPQRRPLPRPKLRGAACPHTRQSGRLRPSSRKPRSQQRMLRAWLASKHAIRRSSRRTTSSGSRSPSSFYSTRSRAESSRAATPSPTRTLSRPSVWGPSGFASLAGFRPDVPGTSSAPATSISRRPTLTSWPVSSAMRACRSSSTTKDRSRPCPRPPWPSRQLRPSH